MEMGHVKPRYVLKPPCFVFPCTRELLPGLEFGSSCGGEEMNEEPNSTSPLPPPKAREQSAEGEKRQGLLPSDNVYYENNKDSSLAWASLTHEEPGKHPFSLKTSHTGIVRTERKT